MSDEEEEGDPYPLRKFVAKKDEDVEVPEELSPDHPPQVAFCIFVERPPPEFDEGDAAVAEEKPAPEKKDEKDEGDQGSLASDDEGDGEKEEDAAKDKQNPASSAKVAVEEDLTRPILTKSVEIPPIEIEVHEDSTINEVRQKLRKAVAAWPDLANKELKDAGMRTGRNKWSDLTPFATVISTVGGTKAITMGPMRIEFGVAEVGKYAYYTKLRGVLRLNFDPRDDDEDYAKDTPAIRRVMNGNKLLYREPRERFMEKLQIELEEDSEDDSDEDEDENRLAEDVYDSDGDKPKSGGGLLSGLKFR